MELIDFISMYIKLIQITDIIDISIVATVIYLILKYIKGTSAYRLIKGVAVLFIITLSSGALQLNTINYILENFMQVGLLSAVVVFQPELRKFLESIGKTKFYRSNLNDNLQISAGEIFINEIVLACERLSKEHEGALIVFERQDNLSDIIQSGVFINSKITSELVRNIFYPKAPLHDGAMVIKNGKIAAAACILPLSNNHNISTDLGTRHRASVGMTEITDALCIVVSEETGSISVASKGMLKRHLSKDLLHKLLRYELLRDKNEIKNESLALKIINYITNYYKQHFSKNEDTEGGL